MSNCRRILAIVLATLGLNFALVAQETEPAPERSTPPPAAVTSSEDNSPSAEDVRPDVRPITGLLPLTVGSFGTERSFVAPSLRFSESLDTNPLLATGASDDVAVVNVSGNVLLQRVWRQSQLSMNYTTGGSLYAGQSDLNRSFQAAQIKQAFQFRRWSLALLDDMTYTPESIFGYAGTAGLATSSFTQGTAPNQTILNNQSQQITNTAGAQANYELNSRSSITVAGDYALLRFPAGNFLESNQAGFQVGYNHSLNSRDALGISYGMGWIWYPNPAIAPAVDSHIVQLTYGRKVTGRLALRLSAGPEIYAFDNSVAGSTNHSSWIAHGALTYRFQHSQLDVGYSHTLSTGAGVLALVRTDQFEGGFSSQLTRTVSAHLRAGYAHNLNLQQLPGSTDIAFETVFIDAGLTRPMGRNADVFLKYSLQYQSANLASCGLEVCVGDLTRHIAELGFDWHMRPILIH